MTEEFILWADNAGASISAFLHTNADIKIVKSLVGIPLSGWASYQIVKKGGGRGGAWQDLIF